MMFLRSILPAIAVLFSLSGFSLQAATANFIPAAGNFNVPANWSTGQIPGPGDTAVVAGNNVCTVTDTRTIASLTLTGGTITVNSPGLLTTGGITLNANTFQNFINGSGTLTLTGAMNAQPLGGISGTGQLVLASGAVMTVPSSIGIQQRGIVIQSGATLTFSASSTASFALSNGASVTIQDGGTFDVNSVQPITAANGATIVNGGTFTKSSLGGALTVSPAVTNTKLLHIQSGIMNFTGGFTDNGGTVFVDGGTFQAPALNLTAGLLTGFGNVMGDLNQTGGVILPGSFASPGVIDVSGNFSQGAGGTLAIPIRGTAPSEDFSRLDVAGAASLGGGLEIVLAGGFIPAPADTFDVVVAGGVTGAFTAVDNNGATIGPVYQQTKVVLQQLANILSVTTVEAMPSPARAGGDVVLTATVPNPGGATLTFKWDFGDGFKGGGNPVTHAFAAPQDTTYTVVVTVFDGQQTVTGTMAVNVLAPNVGGSGASISQGKSSTNPLSGLKISVTASDAGLVEFTIDENQGALSRAGGGIETSFGSDSGVLPTRFGPKVVQKFDKSTIYAASTVVKDSTGATKSKARKTIPVSSREVGQANSALIEPQNRALLTASLKGKFLFNTDKPDQVTYTGSFELPAGLNLGEAQTLVFAMGNVIDSINLTTKGKGVTPSTVGAIKKLQVKFPRVKRKNPTTTAGQIAKITATYFTADLDLKGFDTEGITSTVRDDEAGSKSVERTIQMAMNFSGITYEAAVPVEFKITPKASAGSIQGRRAN